MSKPYKNPRTPCECEYCWKVHKGWRNFDNAGWHLIEALSDSANQLLVHGNLEGVKDRLRRLIKISRNELMKYPRTNFNACPYRITPRERCKMPLTKNGCRIHGYQIYPKFKDVKELI
ncbi:MAG: hypothetical protein V3V41_08025 [Candidatus Heimdallarchaeota archaeon]